MRISLFSFAVVGTSALYMEANPLRRVINILQDTQKELEEEGRKEERLMEKFVCYCDGNTQGMSAEAEQAKQKIEELTARLESDTASKKQTDQELVQHKADRADAIADLKQATAIREKEQAAYEEATNEQRSNIDALKRAVKALEKGMGKAFLQSTQGSTDRARISVLVSMSSALGNFEKRTLSEFLQASSPYGAYSAKSGQIVGILKQLLEDIDRELGGAIAREEEAVSQFVELRNAKKKQIQSHTDAIERKIVRSGELAVAITAGKNDIKATKDNLGDTQRFLAELAISCDHKKQDWETRQKTRANEISSISDAIKVLNDDDALDLFNKTLKKEGPSMLLQRNIHSGSTLRQAISLLKQTSKSKFSNLIASLISGQKVDFTKVLLMIDEMVKVLGQEQKDDDNHRDFCNDEFNKNDNSIKDSSRKISQLQAEIEDKSAASEQAESEIETAEQEIKSLDKAVAEATEQRKEEHEEYVKTTTELTAAVQLIEKAINKLNRFYNPALYSAPPADLTEEQRIAQNLGQDVTATHETIDGTDQTVYAQIRIHKAGDAPAPPPETYGAYQKKTAKSGGVIALMNKLKEELKVDHTTAEHEEKTGQSDYEELMQDSRDKRESLTVSITELESRKAELDEGTNSAQSSHGIESDNLQDLKKYKSELHGSCDFLVKNFDVRKEARAAEVEALHNAKAVLSGANFS